MRRQGRSLLLATLLCVLSLPVNATVARTLLPETLVQVLGLLLSLFLGFRYSQAYNRWWEARVLWGALVNESRNWRDLLTRVLPSQLPLSLRRRLLQQVVLLMWCLNAELRGSDREAAVLAPQAHELALKLGFKNPCVQLLLQQMAKEQFKLHQDGWLDSVESREFGRVQQEITNALGGFGTDPSPAPSCVIHFFHPGVDMGLWLFGVPQAGCHWPHHFSARGMAGVSRFSNGGADRHLPRASVR